MQCCGECCVEILDLSGFRRTLSTDRAAWVQSLKTTLAKHWSIPVTCQKLFLSPAIGVARLLDDHESIIDLQKESSTENLQLTLVACVDGLLLELSAMPSLEFWDVQEEYGTYQQRDSQVRDIRTNVFNELLMAAQWMPRSEERLPEKLREMLRETGWKNYGTQHQVVLLALARWAWKGDKAAHEEFTKYLERFFTPKLVERLQLLQLEFEPYAEGDDHVALLMAAAITLRAVKLSQGEPDQDGARWSRPVWSAEIIARMVPQGDLRAVRMLAAALRQPRAIVRKVAANALNCMPWKTSLRTLISVMLSRHPVTPWPTFCKSFLQGLDVIALQAALKLCLGDERSVKVRCAAKETSVHWQYFLPQHDNITEPVTPQLKWPLNKCHSRNEYTATGSCDTGIKSKLASNVKANEKEKQKEKKKESGKEQDCIAHQEENSMNWCQEYYALKADRRALIRQSRLSEGKTRQWRSNQHHRNPHQERSPRKPKSKGRRAIRFSWQQSAGVKTSLPRRAFACEVARETICPLDLEWGHEYNGLCDWDFDPVDQFWDWCRQLCDSDPRIVKDHWWPARYWPARTSRL